MALRELFVAIVSVHLILVFAIIPEGSIMPSQFETTVQVRSNKSVYHNSPPAIIKHFTYAAEKDWIDSAFQYLRHINCSLSTNVLLTSERECSRLKKASTKRQSNVYIAGHSGSGGLRVVLPDSSLTSSETHDVVLVIDPYPSASFGHTVVLFYVDFNKSIDACTRNNGLFTSTGSNDCLYPILKTRCINELTQRRRRMQFSGRCQINFLPFVYGLSDTGAHVRQLLTCRDSYSGLAPCPAMNPDSNSSGIVCDALNVNSKKCETTRDIVDESLQCLVTKICDQAVLVSGGWNQINSRRHYADGVGLMYAMLQRNGGQKSNVKIFMSVGSPHSRLDFDGARNVSIYPATSKLPIRTYLQHLCSTRGCVDSLVVYFNGAATPDGTILLWDADQNGLASDIEQYRMDELMSDLADCKARHVHVILDQSYAGVVLSAFKRSKRHQKVKVYTSSRSDQYAFNADFTRLWTNTTNDRRCTSSAFKFAQQRLRHSSAKMHAGNYSPDVDITGSRCDANPKLHYVERYFGCQTRRMQTHQT